MNTMLLETSRWLSDYFLLATVLLAGVLLAERIVGQPARRIAIAWSAAIALFVLTFLTAMPNWSSVHMLPTPLVAEPIAVQPIVGPTIPRQPQLATLMAPTAPVVAQPVPHELFAIDYGVVALRMISAGTSVVALWLLFGAWQVHRLRSRAAPPSSELADLFAKISTEGGASAQLGIVRDLPVAAAVGLRRPMVLLPQTMAESDSAEKLETVLAHELAHIRHRDLWLLALLRGLLLILWAHPLYWLWRKRVRLDQETLADAAASEVTDRQAYAEQLVAWARDAAKTQAPRFASSVGLWESPSQLRRRVAVLLDEKLTVLRSCSRRWRLISSFSIAVVALGLSLVTLKPASLAVAEQKTASADIVSGAVRTLANDVTVELLAIGTHAQKVPHWWDATGKVLTKLPFEAQEATNISPRPNRQVVFRVRDIPTDASVRWSTLPASNTGEGTVVVDGKKNPRGYHCHAFERPRGDKFALRVGVAAGEWRTVVRGISGSNNTLMRNVVFSRALSDPQGDAVVIVSHNYSKVATRGIAIDKSGKQHVATSRGDSSAGSQNQTQWTFEEMKPEDVRTFGLQIRAYEWAEFLDLPVVSDFPVEEEAGTQEPFKTLKFATDKGLIRRLDPSSVKRAPWTPVGLVVHSVYGFDPSTVLSQAGELIDTTVGYHGALEDALEGLKVNAHGPQIDVSKEIFGNLSGVIVMLVEKQDAAFAGPQKWLIAIQVTDAKAISSVIDRLAQINPRASLREISGRRVWQSPDGRNENFFTCVDSGQLLIATNAALLQQVFAKNSTVTTTEKEK